MSTSQLGIGARISMALCCLLLAGTLALAGCQSGGATSGAMTAPPACALQSANNTVVNAESQFKSSYVSVPFTGAAIVTNGVFSNIYLWPHPDAHPWDAYLSSLDSSLVSPGETSETLDRITCDLVHTSYFDALTQYGIAPPVFAGDETTLASCVDPVMQNASENGGVIQSGAIKDFVNCEESAPGPKTTQVNIFLSPDLMVAQYNQSADVCSIGSAAFHFGYPGTRNYTVIPTRKQCNSTISDLTKSLSHEMVETVSDPGGFGWVHETNTARFLGDLETEFNEGELGDICSGRGLHPTPPVSFEDSFVHVGPLEVAPYWSNADNACVPSALMNETLVAVTGNPIVRFTGDRHTVTENVSFAGNRGVLQVQALEVLISTGADNLNGGSNLGDNATVTLMLSSGDTYTTTNINEGNGWADQSLHSAFLSFPPGLSLGSIASVTVSTALRGDNWNVDGITLEAAAARRQGECAITPVTLLNAQGTATLPDGTIGLTRLTGDQHAWRIPVHYTGAQAGDLLTDLQLTIGTGGDGLDGGNNLSNTADAIITLASGQSVTFFNINGSGAWGNHSTASVPLLTLNALPANTALGDITSLAIVTHFTGGISGDNWDIANVELLASAGCPRTNPAPITGVSALFDVTGTQVLADGSTGLARLTGDSSTWSSPIAAPATPDATLVELQLTITTGQDDLRGGGQPTDNANVIIHYVNAGDVTYTNVNQSQHWDTGSTHTVALVPIPVSTTLGDIQKITIVTAFTGGISGDNWDILRVRLVATYQQ